MSTCVSLFIFVSKIGWPSGDSDRAASRGSECTSEEEDEFDNGEDEEKKDDCRGHSRPATPTLLGHEVMEERARFTVRCYVC